MIFCFCEHDLTPFQVLATHSGLRNPGMIPYSACLILMLVAVWPWADITYILISNSAVLWLVSFS